MEELKPMEEVKAAIREFIAGKILGLALAIDAEFVFTVIGQAIAQSARIVPADAEKPPAGEIG